MRRGRKEEVNNNLALTFFLSADPCVLALTVKSLDVGQSRRLTISHGLIGKEEDLGGHSDKKMVRKFIITFHIINETKKIITNPWERTTDIHLQIGLVTPRILLYPCYSRPVEIW